MANQLISAFTPSLMSPTELEQIFVQREDLAQDLLDKILLSATTPAKHYALLIGMRGIGKTHLVALIYYRLLKKFEEIPGLQSQLVIAWLREEEWGVDSWLDLVSRILRALAIEEPQSRSLLVELRRISIEDSIAQAAASATQLLKQAIGKRTLLLIVENLDDLFKGLGEAGQQKFRAFLQEEQCCTILATTPALFSAVQSRSKPFFGFFNPIHLDRLTVPEAIEMLRKIATLSSQADLASFLQTPVGRARVRAVHHLAGGNPRVYMLFSQFITRDALDNLVQAFMKMLDELTPYYQARMKELSNQQRKIVELLVDRRYAVMVKEIAADCFIDAGTAGSQLRDLRKLGYVEATQDGRESLYELREVLMRLCLEVKKQRGQWVEIFVEFLRIWYPLSERKNQLELMRGSSICIGDEHLERAFLSEEDPCFVSSRRDLNRALMEERQSLAIETLEELFHSERISRENYPTLLQLIELGQYDKAQTLCLQVVGVDSQQESRLTIELQRLRGDKLLSEGQYSAALEVFNGLLAEDESDIISWVNKGACLDKLDRYEEAIISYDRAIEIQPNRYESWLERGISLLASGKYEKAITSFDRAIKIRPDRYESWFDRGFSLYILDRYEEAIASFDRAIEIQADRYLFWDAKGFTLFKLRRYTESINCYDRSIAIDLNHYNSWYEKGMVHFALQDYPDAMFSWNQAFEIVKDINPRPDRIAFLIQQALIEIVQKWTLFPADNFVPQLLLIYQSAGVLPELSTALIATLPQILAPNISDRAATEWLSLLQNILGDEPILEMPLCLMRTAIEYKKHPNRQKRLWLGLAKEERSILDRALGLEASTPES